MKQPFIEKNIGVNGLISEYEAMSQRGAVPFLEETVFLEIANWYAENSLPDRALGAVEDALKHYSLSLDFHIFRALLLLQNSHTLEACQAICHAQEIAPDEKRILLYRAEAYCLRDDHLNTTLILSSLKTPMTPEKNTAFALRQARLFEQMEEYGKMYDILAEVAIRQPDNDDVLEQIWMCVEITENYSDSKALHETVLDRHPYSHYAWHNLGFAYLHLKNISGALDAFEYSFITNPLFEAGYREFASLAFENGYYNRAIQCYREMSDNLGEDAFIFIRIGECYARLGDTSIAQSMYESALRLDPYNAEAHFRIGQVYAEKQDFARAMKWLKQAVLHDNNREEFHLLLADVYFCLGKEEDSLTHYWRSVEIAPEEQVYWTKVVRHYMLANEVEEALEVIGQALENCIKRNELLYYRTACLFLTGKKQEANRQLRKALATDADSLPVLYQLVPNLKEMNDFQKIINNLKK